MLTIFNLVPRNRGARNKKLLGTEIGAAGVARTRDFQIFSLALSQLSYRGIALGRFELPSPAPKAGMIDHYTTGLIFNDFAHEDEASIF